MLWQYRTILFEFTKDGLLGDRYVDDEEMEKALNQLGRQSWELVNVSLLQDGLLAFLKRPEEDELAVAKGREREGKERAATMQTQRVIEPAPSPSSGPTGPTGPTATPIAREPRPAVGVRTPAVAEQSPMEEREHLLHGFDRQRRSGRDRDDVDLVGGIKIS